MVNIFYIFKLDLYNYDFDSCSVLVYPGYEHLSLVFQAVLYVFSKDFVNQFMLLVFFSYRSQKIIV